LRGNQRGLVMDYDADHRERDYSAEEHYSTQGPEVGFGADAYEQLKVLEERRKLAVAERRKYEALRVCLILKKALVEAKSELAATKLATVEAQRDRAREYRLACRDRRRALKLRKKLLEKVHDFAAEAQTEHEKRVYLEEAVLLDPQAADYLKCPECGKRMEYDDRRGRHCPRCGHEVSQ
jgi:hypothetical protein